MHHFFLSWGGGNGGVYDTLVLLTTPWTWPGTVWLWMLLQLGGNGIVGLVVFAGDEDTSGIHVNAVDDSRTQARR